MGTVGKGDCRNYYEGHMDNNGWGRKGREVGRAGELEGWGAKAENCT